MIKKKFESLEYLRVTLGQNITSKFEVCNWADFGLRD